MGAEPKWVGGRVLWVEVERGRRWGRAGGGSGGLVPRPLLAPKGGAPAERGWGRGLQREFRGRVSGRGEGALREAVRA